MHLCSGGANNYFIDYMVFESLLYSHYIPLHPIPFCQGYTITTLTKIPHIPLVLPVPFAVVIYIYIYTRFLGDPKGVTSRCCGPP